MHSPVQQNSEGSFFVVFFPQRFFNYNCFPPTALGLCRQCFLVPPHSTTLGLWKQCFFVSYPSLQCSAVHWDYGGSVFCSYPPVQCTGIMEAGKSGGAQNSKALRCSDISIGEASKIHILINSSVICMSFEHCIVAYCCSYHNS